MKKSLILLFMFTMIISACDSSTAPTPSQSEPTFITSELRPTGIPPTPTPSAVPPTPTLAPETDFIKGIWFADWGLGDGLSSVDGEIVLKDIVRPLGANWIAIQVPCRMEVINPDVIECNVDNSLSEADIQKITTYTHSLGLRVALLPFILDVVGVPGGWSANLNFGNEANSWSRYFASYAATIIPYAKLAEQLSIDLLIIGGEQTGAQGQEDHWRALISQIRSVYHGPITYEAWCQHFDSVKWWDAVDYIGVNFYCYPLSTLAEPTYGDVKNHYIDFLTMIQSGTSQWNKKVIFTEIGYESIDGVARVVPFGVQPVHLDVEEQGLLARAFFDALIEMNTDGWAQGLFWYNYTSNPLQGGVGDLNFTPHYKPAEDYIRAFYSGTSPTTSATPAVNQIEEDQIGLSYWLFDDALEHDVQLPHWDQDGVQSIVPDPLRERGQAVALQNTNFHLWFSPVNLRDYDYIELYLYSPVYEPNLEIQFDDAQGNYIPRRLYIRNFLDHEPLMDNHWHRVQIPIERIFPPDRNDIPATITTINLIHMWPGQPEPFTFYVDDVRLITQKNHLSFGPTFTEDPNNSMYLYRDGLENDWQMWTDEGGMTLSDLNASPGYQSTTSILVQLSKIGTLTLINGPIDMINYKWLEFYIKVGEKPPKSLLAGLGDWSLVSSPYLSLLVDTPIFIEGGEYQPGTWQRVRIPLSYFGITDQQFGSTAFNIRNCAGWPCDANSIADDVYIDDLRLVAGK